MSAFTDAVDDLFRQSQVGASGQASAATLESAITTHLVNPAVVGLDDTEDLGYLSVIDYGAVGDDSTDCTEAIQDAIDAATAGQCVFFPPGTYRVSAPLRHNKAQVTLKGAGRFVSIIKNSASFGGCVVAMGPTENPVPTTTALGNGAALDMREMQDGMSGDTGNVYLNLRESHTMELDGLSNICLEFQLQTPSAWPAEVRNVASSVGTRFASDGSHTSWKLETAAPSGTYNGLAFSLMVGSTAHRLVTASLSTSTYYHVALNYDGSNVRLFVNGTQVDSASASGTITQRNYETTSIGHAYFQWPYSSAISTEALPCIVDSFRCSVSRYTSGFTAPAAGKLTLDGSTKYVINFNEQEGPFTVGYSTGGSKVFHMAIRPVQAVEITFAGIESLGFQASYAGAIHSFRCQQGFVRDIAVTVGRYGLLYRDNCYLADVSNFYFVASQSNAWWGIANLWACGPNTFFDINITGSAYGMIFGAGSATVDLFYNSGIESYGILSRAGTTFDTQSFRLAAINDEARPSAMDGAVGLDGPATVIFELCTFEQSAYDVPLVTIDSREGAVFNACTFVARPAGTQPLFRILDGDAANQVRLSQAVFSNTSGHARCDTAGWVVADTDDATGVATVLEGNTTVAVTFANAQPDASFAPILSPGADVTAYWSDRATTGFTINIDTAAPEGGTPVAWRVGR